MAPHHLPHQFTPFLGRAEEIAELAALLADPDCRLLTLVGPGGIGKTRLALEAARQWVAPQGVYFVPLQPLESSTLIASAIADALDFQFYQTSDAQQQLLDYLREQSLLLVLDNFEHLLDGTSLVSELLADAPGVKVLVTSRETLNLQEEWFYLVKGMPFPPNDQTTNPEDYSAVRLFVQHARRIRADFSLAAEQAGVVRICALVEGMPLGIELAAAWVRALSCAEIAAELEASLDILSTPARNAPERHRNMRAVLDQSWQRLSDAEREVFKKLSVFRGGITRQAAQRIANAALATLSALVDKSFLQHDPNGRYSLHELLRQYGDEQLNRSPVEAEQIRDQHCTYFAEFMRQREADVKGRRQLAALDEIEAEFENVRAAWSWAVRQNNFDAIRRALESLFLFCEMRGRFQAGKDLFQQAQVRLAGEPNEVVRRLWGRIVTRTAWMSGLHEDFPEQQEAIQAQLDTSLALAQTHKDRPQVGFCLWLLGALALFAKHYALGLTSLQQSWQVFTELGDRFYTARAADWLGAAYGMRGELEHMVTFSQQSLDIRRALGDRYGVAQALTNLTEAAVETGHYGEAERYAHEMGAIYLEIGSRVWASRRSAFLMRIAFEKGEFQKAQALAEEALEIVTNTGGIGVAQSALVVLGRLAALEEDYERSWQLCERAVLKQTPPALVGIPQEGLAIAACGLGDYPTALQNLLIALESILGIRDTRGLVGVLPIAAVVLVHESQKVQAVELIGMAFTRPASGKAWLECWPLLTRLRAELETDLGSETYAAAWERGKAGDLEAVVTALLEQFQTEENQPQSAAAPVANQALIEPLSDRELEVLRLIAAGASNPEIADQLVIGMSTVKKHITHIFAKLGVETRTQALVRARALHLL